MTILLSQHARQAEDVLFQEVGGEAVLLNLSSESYFGLDPVGTRIWKLLADERELQAVLDALCAEFDAPPTTIREDLMTLVAGLAEAGLVVIE